MPPADSSPLVNPRLDQCDAFALVQAERAYQNRKWGPIDAHPHEVGAWLLVMKGKFDAAIAAWQGTPGDGPALANLVKAVAVGVACLEQHGGGLLARMLADMEFTKTNRGYMSPSLRSECYWPVLEAIRQRIKDQANRLLPLRPPFIITDRSQLREWVKGQTKDNESAEIIDAITESILHGDHPHYGKDWTAYLTDIDDVYDLIRD